VAANLQQIALLIVVLATPAARGAEEVVEPTILDQKPLYSQRNEEIIIRHFFQDERDGFFVDVGSYHWKKASTTYYLEEHLGWSGIAVDAQKKFRTGYEANRPKTRFFSYLVSDESDLKRPFYLAGPVSSESKEHVQKFSKVIDAASDPAELEVETITLDDLLAANHATRIDFLSVDVEGAERKVLEGFGIEKYKPRLACVSAGRSVREEVLAYFREHDYEKIDGYEAYDRVNLYFRPTDHSP